MFGLENVKTYLNAYKVTNKGCLTMREEKEVNEALSVVDKLIDRPDWSDLGNSDLLLPDEMIRMFADAEAIKTALNYCSYVPGADITISIKTFSGTEVIGKFYDQAALVQSLFEAMSYFQSELI